MMTFDTFWWHAENILIKDVKWDRHALHRNVSSQVKYRMLHVMYLWWWLLETTKECLRSRKSFWWRILNTDLQLWVWSLRSFRQISFWSTATEVSVGSGLFCKNDITKKTKWGEGAVDTNLLHTRSLSKGLQNYPILTAGGLCEDGQANVKV